MSLGGRTTGTQLAVSILVSVSGVSFIFLTGALAVTMAGELGMEGHEIGSAVALSYLTATILVRRVARWLEPWPIDRAVLLACALNAGTLAAAGLLLRSELTLYVFAFAAGVGLATSGVAGNLVLSRGGVGGRLGLLFGLKQSGASVAGMLAGLALTLSAGVSWRWPYVGFAVVSAATAVAGPVVLRRHGHPCPAEPPPDLDGALAWSARSLWLAAFGGTLIAGSLTGFAAVSLVEWGIDARAAGMIILTGGFGSVVARVVFGLLVDRWRARSFTMMLWSITVGSLGVVIMVLCPPLRTTGMLLAFAAGWGWPGLGFLVSLQRLPEAPAVAAGVMLSASSFGLGVAPLVLRFAWDWQGPAVGWLLVAGVSVATVLYASSHLRTPLAR